MNRFYFLILVFLSFAISAANLDSEIWNSLSAGDYNVGFKNHEVTDFSRTYQLPETNSQKLIYRPIHINIWYPALENSNATMDFADYQYIAEKALNPEFDKSKPEFISELKELYVRSKADADLFEKIFYQKTIAVLEAEELTGSFPVVIYSPGGGEIASENFVLCELLASNGYIVISSPSVGFDRLGVQTTLSDIRFLFNYVQNLKFAQKDNIALVGFCFGSMCNMIFAEENHFVKAIVGLHSEYLNPDSRRDYSLPDSPVFANRNLAYLELDGSFLKHRDSEVFNKMYYSDRYQVHFSEIPHNGFTSFYVMQSHCFEKELIRGRDNRDLTYELSCRLILAFLNHYLKGEANFEDNKKAILSEQKIPKSLLLVDNYNAAKPAPPSKAKFMEIVESGNTRDMTDLYQQVRKIDPEIILFGENDLLRPAYKFLGEGNEHAIAIFKLIIDSYPNGWNGWDSLGEAYREAGNLKESKNCYEKALELKGKDERIEKIIEELKSRGKHEL
ncbi:MAG: tetratricopeptide repeat protein [Candidatus Cloacimonetes bacterium]|nr:tetratricopeptide repeat protein [Candidatus Cloacimonadota bacterium]